MWWTEVQPTIAARRQLPRRSLLAPGEGCFGELIRMTTGGMLWTEPFVHQSRSPTQEQETLKLAADKRGNSSNTKTTCTHVTAREVSEATAAVSKLQAPCVSGKGSRCSKEGG